MCIVQRCKITAKVAYCTVLYDYDEGCCAYCTLLDDYDEGCYVCIVKPCMIMAKVVCTLYSVVCLRRMLLCVLYNVCTVLNDCGEGCCAELYNAVCLRRRLLCVLHSAVPIRRSDR